MAINVFSKYNKHNELKTPKQIQEDKLVRSLSKNRKNSYNKSLRKEDEEKNNNISFKKDKSPSFKKIK